MKNPIGMRLNMIIDKKLCFFFFFITHSLFGLSYNNTAVSTGRIDLETFKDIDEISLTVKKLHFGSYGIFVLLYPHDGYMFREIESPINLEFVLVIEQEGKIIEKRITHPIRKGFLGFSDEIFRVPRNFKWNGKLNIRILNIKVGENIINYYKEIKIAVVY